MTSDKPKRIIRKKYTGPNGELGIHVPATSTPENIQKASALNSELCDLEIEPHRRGILIDPPDWRSDHTKRMGRFVENLTKGQTTDLNELMAEEIDRLVAAFQEMIDELKKAL